MQHKTNRQASTAAQDQDDWEVVVMVRTTEDEATKVLDDVAEFIYGRDDLDATVVMRREEPVE